MDSITVIILILAVAVILWVKYATHKRWVNACDNDAFVLWGGRLFEVKEIKPGTPKWMGKAGKIR